FERGAKPGFEVARAAAPDAPVDQRAAERILALGARPSLPPALHLHGVGVTDQEQRVAAIAAAPPAPYIRPARLKIARPDVLSADRGEFLLEQRREGGLLTRHGRRRTPRAVGRGELAIARSSHSTAEPLPPRPRGADRYCLPHKGRRGTTCPVNCVTSLIWRPVYARFPRSGLSTGGSLRNC